MRLSHALTLAKLFSPAESDAKTHRTPKALPAHGGQAVRNQSQTPLLFGRAAAGFVLQNARFSRKGLTRVSALGTNVISPSVL